MIYPEKLNSRKNDKIVKVFITISIVLGLLLVLINHLTVPNVPWAAVSNAGIIYVWIVVYYATHRNTNIAGHVLLQTIALSILSIFIDYKFGMAGWAFNIIIPIIIIISNVTMAVLTIVSHKKYIKYAFCQLIIVIFSLFPIYLIKRNIVHNVILCIVASSISAGNFLLSLLLCAKAEKEAIIRKFHI